MTSILSQSIPWYFAGPLIALSMWLLLKLGQRFGLSSNLRTICSIAGAGKHVKFFNFEWKKSIWNLVVVAGIISGSLLSYYGFGQQAPQLHEDVVIQLETLGITDANTSYLPDLLFSPEKSSASQIIILVVAGLLVGFGARYAGGCTSGHAISGLSNLQLPSFIAVIGFFIGGLIMVHLILPLIL